jgi:uncharacterized protein (DUF1697 family)
MQIYIAILRGVNVSGHKKLPMAELRELLAELKYRDIRTYIQSGNIVFGSDAKDSSVFAAQIAKKIKEKYGFDVPVLTRTVTEMKQALESNPFLKEKNTDPEKLHITFLDEAPSKENFDKANAYSCEPDRFHIHGREVYVYCPNGYGNTKLSNTFFENKLKVNATTRNLKTVRELVRMGEELF